jgi:hypothetical protein
MAFPKKPSNLHIQRRRLWGLRMGKTTYKEQTIETETKMVITLRRLLGRTIFIQISPFSVCI